MFISSTLDLAELRAAAKGAIESLNLTPVMFEAGARPHAPRALYRAYLEQSDVFVAIYSKRYGWTAPDMDVSGLEDEFNLSAGMPRLVYIESTDEREPELVTFLSRVSEEGLSYRPFSSASELADLVKSDLSSVLAERFHTVGTQARGVSDRAPLPSPATAFLGRDAELRDLAGLLSRDDVRLVTLTGPGGIGKTRLAIEAARHLLPRFPGGMFFVSLEALRESTLIGDTIAVALDVGPGDAPSALAAVVDFLRDGHVLLVLDNFEQVIEGATAVAQLLAACEHTTIIVTSRAPLRVRGEHEFAVQPLPVPSESEAPGAVGEFSAAALFVEAARNVRPDFDLDDVSGPVVAEICRQLDGLPLAIELAGALVRVFTPSMLLERLRDRLIDLGGALRDMPARHQRLADTIAWSYDLLDDSTKELFAQLGVFRGGFTLELAEQVCDVTGDLLTGIASLAEQSLLRADVRDHDGVRFSMLTTIRRFAWERLNETSRRDEVLSRHAALFTDLLSRVASPGAMQRGVPEQVETELDNIRRALEWLLAMGDCDRVAEVLSQSWWFWSMRGLLKEGTLWTDRCLAAASLSREGHGRVLSARGNFAIWSGEFEVAEPSLVEAATIARETQDVSAAAYADIALGLARSFTSSIDAGAAIIQRAVAAFEEAGDEAGATTGLSATAWVQGVTRQFSDDDATFVQALHRARAIGGDVEIGVIASALAQLRMSRGDREGAYEPLTESLDHLTATRHITSTIVTLEVIAELGLVSDAVRRSVVVLGATATIRAAMGTRLPPPAAARLQALLEAGRQRLGSEFDTAYESGSRLGFPEAVEHGRALLEELNARR